MTLNPIIQATPNRNAFCPCGSRKKYKHCCVELQRHTYKFLGGRILIIQLANTKCVWAVAYGANRLDGIAPNIGVAGVTARQAIRFQRRSTSSALSNTSTTDTDNV
jgi:hypothetical protein